MSLSWYTLTPPLLQAIQTRPVRSVNTAFTVLCIRPFSVVRWRVRALSMMYTPFFVATAGLGSGRGQRSDVVAE